jgi:hypothetical protein
MAAYVEQGMVVIRAKTIAIGRYFEFDVPDGFKAHRWPHSDSQYDLRSRTSWDCKLMVDCAAPGLKDQAGPVDEEQEYQRWAAIFGQSRAEDVVSKPFGQDPDACVFPCWTFEMQRPAGTFYCGAVVRNAGGVLAVYGSASSGDIVTGLRSLLKTLRTPAALSGDDSGKGH